MGSRSMLILGDLLDEEALGPRLVVGAEHDRERVIAGAHPIDVPQPLAWVDRDWLVLTAGTILRDDQASVDQLVPELVEAEVAALAFGIEPVFDHIPEPPGTARLRQRRLARPDHGRRRAAARLRRGGAGAVLGDARRRRQLRRRHLVRGRRAPGPAHGDRRRPRLRGGEGAGGAAAPARAGADRLDRPLLLRPLRPRGAAAGDSGAAAREIGADRLRRPPRARRVGADLRDGAVGVRLPGDGGLPARAGAVAGRRGAEIGPARDADQRRLRRRRSVPEGAGRADPLGAGGGAGRGAPHGATGGAGSGARGDHDRHGRHVVRRDADAARAGAAGARPGDRPPADRRAGRRPPLDRLGRRLAGGGALRVGPDSAGSAPGPAAYGNGGVHPTVTDANLVLGYLPEALLGGRKALSRRLAEEAIARDVAEPLHAARLARHLEMRQVLIPAEAGGLSSFGMMVTDVRHDYSFALHTTTGGFLREQVEAGYAELVSRARADLLASGLDPDATRFERSVDARYEGQVHTLVTTVPDTDLEERALATLRSSFDAAHDARFSYDMRDRPVEFLQWRMSAITPRRTDVRETFDDLPAAEAEPARRGFRPAIFDLGNGAVETPVFDAAALPAGAIVAGPAILDSETSTIVVPPGDSLRADGRGNFLLAVG